MIYLIGSAGLICGFMIGQLVLAWRLHGYSREEILEMAQDKTARTSYGLLNWLIAGVSAALFVSIYKFYFGG